MSKVFTVYTFSSGRPIIIYEHFYWVNIFHWVKLVILDLMFLLEKNELYANADPDICLCLPLHIIRQSLYLSDTVSSHILLIDNS